MSHSLRMLTLLVFGAALASCSDVPATGAAGTAAPPGPDLSLPLAAPVTRSYEVAIATAAADQVRGLEDCSTRPRAELADCRKQVNDAYESARSAALVIRGTDR